MLPISTNFLLGGFHKNTFVFVFIFGVLCSQSEPTFCFGEFHKNICIYINLWSILLPIRNNWTLLGHSKTRLHLFLSLDYFLPVSTSFLLLEENDRSIIQILNKRWVFFLTSKTFPINRRKIIFLLHLVFLCNF